MNISGSGASYSWRRCRTCRAMMSRNDNPRRTHSRDFARSMPIEVPRPPLSLITAVAPDRLRGDVVGDLDVGERLHVDRLDGGLGDHPGLPVLEEPVVVREDLDGDRVDPGVLHLRARHLQSCTTHDSIVGLPVPDRNGMTNLVDEPPRRRQDRPARPAAHGARPSFLGGGRGGRTGDGGPCWRHPEVRRAATVAAYVSVGSEPGTGRLLDGLVEAGKRVILPVVLPEGWTWSGRRTPGPGRWRRRATACSSRSARR